MYFITALTGLDRFRYSRCFGHYADKNEALTAVQENRYILDEGFYNYIVVEKIAQGIHCITEEEIWFKWFQEGPDNDNGHGEGHWYPIRKALATDPDKNHAIG